MQHPHHADRVRAARIPLAALPTPLQEAKRLREALGGARRSPRILLKRDDLTGLAFGGNKARKLEFLVGDALAAGATTLVTTGAVQSNHARMTAAAARAVGMNVVLVLTTRADPPPIEGNLLLDHLFGAELRFVLAGPNPMLAIGDDEAIVSEIVADRCKRGDRPYVIPIGGSSAIGALGYVEGTRELVGQLAALGERPTRLYFASGSRGTQAGLELGARVYQAPYKLVGVAVSGGEAEKRTRAWRIGNEAAAIIGTSTRLIEEELLTDQSYIGEGYGMATRECMEAIRLLAQSEGIVLDPVYTGKAMAGLIDHIRRGAVRPDDTVVFLHTGGTPAVFTDSFREAWGAG